MSFDLHKKQALGKKDSSKKGHIDREAEGLIRALNSKPDYYTTSSCAGRIVLLKLAKRKNESEWMLSSHKPVGFNELKAALRNLPKEEVWFRQEPFIAHVACRTIDDAARFLNVCNEAGFKHSGIMSMSRRVIIEVQGNDKVDTIVANGGKMLCDDNYLKSLIAAANRKLRNNLRKVRRFEALVRGV